MPDFQVWVRTGAEEPVCVEVPSEGTVGDVIAALPGDRQSGAVMRFAGEKLAPATALADAGIGNEAVLECVLQTVPRWVCASTIEQRQGSDCGLELVKLETGQASCNCPEMLTPGYEYRVGVLASSGRGSTGHSAAIVLCKGSPKKPEDLAEHPRQVFEQDVLFYHGFDYDGWFMYEGITWPVSDQAAIRQSEPCSGKVSSGDCIRYIIRVPEDAPATVSIMSTNDDGLQIDQRGGTLELEEPALPPFFLAAYLFEKDHRFSIRCWSKRRL
eukprot:TRINITY_DN1312_c0_g1_i1.p1 TRINITY_DN1312_c0_g1~~TRINITY_DN1312_c0_g1_i1.p1  ORF type:complete len:296 (+),score=74.95 TRINITY_DN1312_c0_g1_i1:77-889(+)